MRILITGVTGFIGRHLAAALLADGHRVSGCAVGEGMTVPGVDVADVDLLDESSLADVVCRADPEAVFHLGGLSHVGASFGRPGDYFRVNVLGTRNVLAALERQRGRRGPEARVVFASSAEVYGAIPEDEQPIDETRDLAPRSPYAWSKAAGEQLVLAAGGIVVRAFNIVGPGQAPTFALPSFARQLAAISAGRSAPRLKVGDLSSRRDFIHVADAVSAYRTVLEHGTPGAVFNLASGEAHGIGNLLDRLRRIAEVEVEVEVDDALVRPIDVPLLRGDSSRLRALGWRPERTVDDALADLWREARTSALDP